MMIVQTGSGKGLIGAGIQFLGLALLLCLFFACGRERSASISGTIRIEGTENFEGAQVYVPGTQFRAVTDAKGQFAIQGLNAGEWSLVAELPGYESTRTSFTLLHAEDKSLPPILLLRQHIPAGSVTGFVVMPGENTHDKVAVMLVGTNYTTSTNTTGHFSLAGVKPGAYQLLAIKEGWFPSLRDEVVVHDGQDTKVENIQLRPAVPLPEPTPTPPHFGDRAIRGYALLEGQENHEGTLVALENVPSKQTVTNATGFFEIGGLGNEIYNLVFNHEGYIGETWADIETNDATSTVAAGIITLRREIDANRTGILSGTVLLEGQTEHSNTLLQLLGVSQSVVTDNTGRYMFLGVPAGDYILLAEHPGYEPMQIPGVRIAPEQISSVTDFTLLRSANQELLGRGSLQGAAMLEGETDHGGITVSFQGTPLSVVTGIAGEYTFPEVPAGAYVLLFSKGGFKNQYLEAVRIAANQNTQLEPVTLVRDIEPPYVIDTFPPNNARKVPVYRFVDVLVRFSERMAGDSVKRAVQIMPPVGFDAYFDNESELSQFDLLHLRLYQTGPMPLQFKTNYTVSVMPIAATPKGVPMAAPFQFGFTTDGPLVVNSFPAQGASQVMLGVNDPIMLETNVPVNPTTVERALHIRPRPDALPLIQYMQTDVGTQILVNTTLRNNTRYTIQLDNNLRSVTGERFSNAPYSFGFRTVNFGESFNRSSQSRSRR